MALLSGVHAATSEWTLEGVVLNATNGTPLKKALVRLTGAVEANR